MTAQAGWQAFSHDSLPRLPAQAAKWTAALARARSRIPLAVTIAAKGVGEVEIHPDQVTMAEEGEGNEGGLVAWGGGELCSPGTIAGGMARPSARARAQRAGVEGKVQVPKSPKGEASGVGVAGGGPKGEANPPRVPISDGMDYFPLEREGERGWVGVSHRVSLALVQAVLGGPAPAAFRPLARGERGVMAAILLSALDALGISQRVELGLRASAGRPDSAPPQIAVGGSIRTAKGLAGRVLVLIPVGWLAEAAWTGPVTARVERLMANATVELARTDLLGAALASAGVGDTVVFDSVAGISDIGTDKAWPAYLRVGDLRAPASVVASGALALTGRFSQVEEESNSMASQDEKAPRIQKESSASEVAKVLAAAPVEVVAEIGRLTLRGDELAGLMTGGVLSLGSRRTDAIQLRVGGQLWAVGELVSVGDELGVRILRLHAG